jgi:hypothetical protein
MIRKTLLFVTTLIALSYAAGAGFKASLVDAEIMGVGPGAGIYAIMDVTRVFQLYPSIEVWSGSNGSDGYHTYYDNGTWVDFTGKQTHRIVEASLNLDMRFVLLKTKIRPFFGFGGAPVLTVDSWKPGLSGHIWGPGFNLFVGIDLRYWDNYMFFIEARGKMGSEYGVAKLSIGTTFGKLK